MPKGTCGVAPRAECIDKTCYWCSPGTSDAEYTAAGLVKRCASIYSSAKCKRDSRDTNCMSCSSIDGACAQCRPGFALEANGRCTRKVCKLLSQNPGCGICNPDGTCRVCIKAGHVVVPDNAQWVNRGYPASKCLTMNGANKLSQRIALVPAVTNAYCVETDAFLRCTACRKGYQITSQFQCSKIKAATRTNACVGRPYGQYCLECASAKCIKCTPGRSPAAGLCSLNCQGLFGFYCDQCTATKCTKIFSDKAKQYGL